MWGVALREESGDLKIKLLRKTKDGAQGRSPRGERGFKDRSRVSTVCRLRCRSPRGERGFKVHDSGRDNGTDVVALREESGDLKKEVKGDYPNGR